MPNFSFDYCRATLVDVGNFEQVEQAWKTSRPYDTNPDMGKVLSMDVPVNEFVSFHFELKAPILIREIICSARNHVVWARSSRVDDLTQWELWTSMHTSSIADCDLLYYDMRREMNLENHQDDFRRHLPLGYMTTFSFSMTFRDLVRFIQSLKDADNQLFDDVVSALLFAVEKYPRRRDNKFDPYDLLEQALAAKAYKASELLPRPKYFGEDLVIGDFASVTVGINLQLRAQLIRHRALMVKDTICDYFSTKMLGKSMESPITSQIVFPLDFAENLIRKRSCWIAQTDLWEPIVSKLNNLIGKDKVMLPCDDGKCRFIRDNDLREQGKDPSPPCPLIAKMKGETCSDQLKDKMKAYAIRRPSNSFWEKVIDNA